MFYVMAHVDGRVIWDPALPDIAIAQRDAYYREVLRVLAAIHDVDVDAVGLSDFGRPGNYFARQIARWSEQYRAAQTDTLVDRSEEHTSELQSLMRISYAVFCLKKKT